MNLRTLLAATAAAGAALALAGVANATTNLSQSAAANATIVQPSSMSASRSLEFGTIALPTVGTSTVQVASLAATGQTPTINNTSGGNAYNVTTGSARAAQFHISGNTGDTFTISSSTLTMTGLGSPTTETPLVVGATGSSTYTLTTGAADVYVGGDITLTPSTAAGTYSGTVSLNIAYN